MKKAEKKTKEELILELEMLKEAETNMKSILDNISDVVFRLSPMGIIQYVSPRVKEFYGYNPEDLIGKHLKKTTPISELPKAIKALKEIFAGNMISNFEIQQIDANGKLYPTGLCSL